MKRDEENYFGMLPEIKHLRKCPKLYGKRCTCMGLRNWLENFLSEIDGNDPSEEYFEYVWKELCKSVEGYYRK